MYDKADTTGMRADLLKFQSSFLRSSPEPRTVQQNWDDFKTEIGDLMES